MKLSNLGNELRAAGLTVVETAGWQNRGYNGQDLVSIDGVLWHHTATNRNAFVNANAPTLNMCVNGRSDLAGPLCHIVLGRDGTVYLVAAGLANHAGRGSAAGIPRDEGNWRLIGIEMESSGVAPWDWTDDQIRVAPYLGAALERAQLMDQPEDLRVQIGHLEYSSEGKIDPAGWPGGMDGLRASINAILAGEVPTLDPMDAPQPAPAPVINLAGSAGPDQCIVDPGDTLSGIAQQFGVDLGALIAINGITMPDLIFPGMVLDLPAKSAPAAPAPSNLPPYCIVDPGDTLGGIAIQYGVPLQYILDRNPGINPDLIFPGQRINL